MPVKAHATAEACRDLLPFLAGDGYVASFQNGLNERVIADAVGERRTLGCFVMLLQETYRHTHDLALVLELRPAWEAALGWMKTDGDPDGDGFLEFRGAKLGKGLVVQSWKDSHDSLSHRDGRLAEGLIAVSEVQGYAYAAYRAAAEFYRALAEPEEAERWDAEAETMRARIHEAFWLEELGTYALALDGDKTPLRVQNSDAGHLLWTGVVPEEIAPRLV